MTSHKHSIVLSTPSDWDIWIDMIKNKAKAADIWKYIDPSIKATDLPEFTRPVMPQPKDVDAAKPLMSQLSPNELEQLKALREEWKNRNREYEQQKAIINSMHTLVHETVSRAYYVYLIDKDTLHDMLSALKERIAPTDRARQRELASQYQKLKKAPRSQNIESWIEQWELTYTKCAKLNLPEVSDTRSQYDFLNTIAEISSEFATTWMVQLQKKEDKGKEITSMYKLIEHFRNYIRLKAADKVPATHGAFPAATFRNQKVDDDGNGKEGKKEDTYKPCLCGKMHRFKSCWYLVEEIRPSGWKPDAAIQRQIDEKIEKNAKLQDTIKRIRKQAAKKDNSERPERSDRTDQVDTSEFGNFAVSVFSDGLSDYVLRDSVILDSGASLHICNDRTRFRTFNPVVEENFVYAGNTVIPIEGFGNITITIQAPGGPRKIELMDTAYIPSFHTTVASLDKFVAKNVLWDMKNNRLAHQDRTICTLERHHGQWTLEFNELKSSSVFTVQSVSTNSLNAPIEVWHQRMGHSGPEATRHLPVLHDNGTAPHTIDCETCSMSKAHKIVSRRPQARADTPFEKIHFDLIQMTIGYNHDRWIAHILCDHTRMNYVYTMARKTGSFTVIRNFVAFARRRYNRHVQVIRVDGETSLGLEFMTWANEKGLIVERSAPYTPAQNGAAERSGKELTTKARAMQIGSNIPEDLWPEMVKTAGYLINRTPSQTLEWKSPLQTLQTALGQDTKMNLDHIRIFGCRTYPVNYKIPRTEKTKPRAHIGYLVGYDSTNIFRIWIPTKKKVISTRDVTFKEDLFYNPRKPTDRNNLRELEEAIDVYEVPRLQQQDMDDWSDTDSEFEISNAHKPVPEHEHEMEDLQEEESSREQEQSLQNYTRESYKDWSYDDDEALPGAFPDDAEPMTGGFEPILPTSDMIPEPSNSTSAFRPAKTAKPRKPRDTTQGIQESNIQEGKRERKPSEKAKARLQSYLAALNTPKSLQAVHAAFGAGIYHKPGRIHRDNLPEPPNSWAELQSHKHKESFMKAAEKEYGDLTRRNTFRMVDRPKNTKILPIRWVFVYKFDTDGYLVKYKARICVRGDLQERSIQDNYAATLAARTFRALMALTAAYDLEAYQFDAISAFTNSELDEIVYIECPDGFKDHGKCLLLLRALYGLRQSPLLWLKEFSKTLHDLSLCPIHEEICLFINDELILFFYVDDIVVLFWRKHMNAFETFKRNLMDRYEIREMGELAWFLGIRVVRDRAQRKLWLCQDSYIKKIATSFHLEHRRSYVPMNTDTLKAYEGQAMPQEAHAYQRKVGSILYVATNTRPDATRTAAKLSEFLKNPGPEHQQAAEQAIAYLNTTRNKAIQYSAEATNTTFMCASDAAFADNIPSRKSTEGFLFTLFGGPIHWRSTKQRTVTTSSTEVELLAMTHTAKELAWWTRFFKAIRFDPGHDFKIHGDNKQTIRILTTTTPQFSTKLRHVDISRNWLRQEVQAGRLSAAWILLEIALVALPQSNCAL